MHISFAVITCQCFLCRHDKEFCSGSVEKKFEVPKKGLCPSWCLDKAKVTLGQDIILWRESIGTVVCMISISNSGSNQPPPISCGATSLFIWLGSIKRIDIQIEGGHKSKVKRVVKFPERNSGFLGKQRVLLGRNDFNIFINVLKGGGIKIKYKFYCIW